MRDLCLAVNTDVERESVMTFTQQILMQLGIVLTSLIE